MDETQTKLEELRTAWHTFKEVAHQTSEDQRTAFREILTEMDTAEATLKRAQVLKVYEQ